MRSPPSDTKVARAVRKAVQAIERLEVAEARQRVRDKRNEATRYYRLGLVLESFLFEEPALLARVEELVRQESPRVRAAFSLDRSPSWFEHPRPDDSKKTVDTRRYWLGMTLKHKQLLPQDTALLARTEALLRAQAPHVRAAFGIGRCNDVISPVGLTGVPASMLGEAPVSPGDAPPDSHSSLTRAEASPISEGTASSPHPRTRPQTASPTMHGPSRPAHRNSSWRISV